MRPPRRGPRPSRFDPRTRIIALLVAACAAPLTHAQVQPPPMILAPAGEYSGRDFGGLRLAITPQDGPFTLSAQRASVWTEDPYAVDPAGATLGDSVTRILLRGDVRLRVGMYQLAAARAVIWYERLEPSKKFPGQFISQVAIYLDRFGDPTGAAGAAPSGDRLLITAVIDGDIQLGADLLTPGRPNDTLVPEAEQRLARFLTELTGGTPDSSDPIRDTTGSGLPIVPGMSQPYEPNSRLLRAGAAAPDMSAYGPAQRTQPIFAKHGVVTISAGEPALIPSPEENALIITGGVAIQYSDVASGRNLQLTAQRAVIFLDPGELKDVLRQTADKVRGVFLEGDVVATDGQFTLRGPSIYYDFRANQAIVVDAVFWTYDQRRGLPIYIRAKALRQTAANQVEGHEVRISTSSFFTPQLSIGASTLTVTRETRPTEPPRTFIEGTDVTGRIQNVPFAWFPSFKGDTDRFPLQDVRLENSSETGLGLKTRWDLFGLIGVDPPPGWNADFFLDAWVNRGVGTGADATWSTAVATGSILGYIVPDDNGEDVMSSGTRIQNNGDVRGIIVGENRWAINENWTAFTEVGYLSDNRFAQAYYPFLAETRREFTNAVDLRRLDANSYLSLYLKGSANDFTPNHYLLQSQGYTVNKMPDIRYHRVNDDLLAGISPGLLAWNHSYSLTRMGFSFTEATANDYGFNTPQLAFDAFGIPIAPGSQNQSPGDQLRARGLVESPVNRLDTRQQFSSTIDAGPVRLNPFLNGRVTYWSNDFSSFSPANNDSVRFWGSGGIFAGTSFTRVYDDAESDLLDMHRARHIIEPSVTAWLAGTNRNSNSLPVYDDSVEAINSGTAVRAGVVQTLQTQRGGPGRWRSVDVLKLRTDFVWAANNTNQRSPIGRFFDDRPEDAALGTFINIDGAWQLTDAVALTAIENYSFDLNQSARTSAGLLIEHTREFKTFIDYRFINPRNATYVDGGLNLRFTDTYTLDLSGTFDADNGQFQTVLARLNRELPNVILSVKVGFNRITDEVTTAFIVTPLDRDPHRQLLHRLGRDSVDDLNELPAGNDIVPGSSK